MKLHPTDIDNETLSIDDQPLYSLDDETISPAGDLTEAGNNRVDESSAATDNQEEDEDEDEDISMLFGANHSNTETPASKPKVIPHILEILLNPVNGWKRFHTLKQKPGYVAMHSLFPVALLAGLSEFSALIFDGRESVAALFKSSLITFLAFFFGYFLIRTAADFLLPSDARKIIRTDKGRNFLLVVVTTLAFFSALPNFLPMLEPILVFLPLWTLYIIFRGMKALRIGKDKETITATILCILVIGIPLLCSRILDDILPGI